MAVDELLSGLVIHCDELTLRTPRDKDVDALVSAYSDDFDFRSSSPQSAVDLVAVQNGMLERIRCHRRPKTMEDWHLELVVEAGLGGLLGWATLEPAGFLAQGRVETTSWVAMPSRRQGYGTSIRKAVLCLAFEGLAAKVALSRVQPANEHSSRISENLGYKWAGFSRAGSPNVMYEHWEMTRGQWQGSENMAEVQGHEPFRDWLHAGHRVTSGPGG